MNTALDPVARHDLSFPRLDRSSYETRYSVAFWLKTWDVDTVTWGQKIADTNGTSGFIAWTDSGILRLRNFSSIITT